MLNVSTSMNIFRKWLLVSLGILFPITSLWCKDDGEDKIYENIATLEGMPSAIVGNVVNAVTGAYCDCQTDLVVASAHPIRIQRFYSSGAYLTGFTSITGPLARAQVWNWNHGGLISISNDSSKYKACVYKGSSLSALIYRSEDDHKHELKISNDFFKHGMTNCHFQEISGRTNQKNTRVFFNKNKNCLVRTGAGVETYAPPLFSYDSTKYRIASETDPNGNSLKYDYQDKDHVALTKISAYNLKKELLGTVSIQYPDEKKWKKEPVIMRTSDGRQASYYFDEGKEINRRLRRVVRSDAPEENYVYDHSSRYSERIVRKELPKGRFLNIEYSGQKEPEKSGRVTFLKAPIGHDGTPHVFYSFDYHKDHTDIGCGTTDVWDAHHNKKVYAHDAQKRLIAINTYTASTIYKAERFYWGTYDIPKKGDRNLVGSLLTSLIQEGKDGPVLSCRHYEYDQFGNILADRLYGNLTGNSPQSIPLSWLGTRNSLGEPGQVAIPKRSNNERFKKAFTYTGAPYNLVSSENNERSIINYSYEPASNRLSSKFICDLQGQIKKRYFYKYDDNAALAKEIVDDGTSNDPQNLSGVTERKITYSSNRKTAPIGLPEVVQEMCLDLATGREILIKKKINNYSTEGYLIRQEHYDSESRLAYILFWKYDSMGNVTEETDALGNTIVRKYDENGNKTSEQKPGLTYVENFSYDFSNRLVSVEEAHKDGRRFKVTNNYNLLSQCVSTIDRFGNETKQEYDELGRCIKTVHPCIRSTDGKPFNPIETTKYNVLDQPIEQLQLNGYVNKTKFTIRGDPYEEQYPDGSIKKSQYTLDGLLSKQWDIDGTLTVYDYDYQERPIRQSCYSAQGNLLFSTITTYNGFHKVSETDAAGHLTTYAYDPAGRIREVKKGEHKTQYIYDSLGRVAKTLEYANTTTFTAKVQRYDFLDRVVEESFEDSQGNIQSKVEYVYDATGNRTQEIRYTESGAAISITLYDSHNRPLTMINAEGHTTHITYRENHRNALNQYVLCKETTDPLGRITVEIFNALGHLEEEIHKNSLGEVIQKRLFYRNGGGLLLKQVETVYVGNVSQREITTLWVYDSKDRLVDCYEAVNTPEQKHTSIRYNNKGQKQAIVKPDGVTINHEYDDWGRLSHFYASDKSFDYTYRYDQNNNVILVSDLIYNKNNRRTYDDYDQLTSETLGNDLQTQFTYDLKGNVTEVQLPDGRAIAYNYEGILLRHLSLLGQNGETSYQHTYTAFDLSGNVLNAQLIGQAGQIENHYDKLSRNTQTTSPHWSESYLIYDKVGNLLQRNISDAEGDIYCLYDYDPLNQLKMESGVSTHNYGCDSVYNRIDKDGNSYQINSLNQLLNDGERTLFYDKNGSLVKMTMGSDEVVYAYDALNRLIELVDGDYRYQYTYDSFNRRLSKDAYFKNAGNWEYQQSTLYLYQGQNEIGAFEGQSCIELRLLGLGKGAEIGAAVAIELNGRTYAPIHDLNGSVVCLLDAETGNVASTYRLQHSEKNKRLATWEIPGDMQAKELTRKVGLSILEDAITRRFLVAGLLQTLRNLKTDQTCTPIFITIP